MVSTGSVSTSADSASALLSDAFLVIAHPGHELRVHAWLERARPRVFVLTDGSGQTGESRIASTAAVLDRVGAGQGSIFGRFEDNAAYQLILARDTETLKALILELSDELKKARAKAVVSDAIEGFNPVHDLCFLIAESAVEIASRRLGYGIQHYDFLLEAAPDAVRGTVPDQIELFRLDDKAWQRKQEAAWAYGLLRSEVERAFGAHGKEAFRIEALRRTDTSLAWSDRLDEPPFYETFGERRVEAAVYDQVLRFRAHFLPLAETLRAWASKA